MTQAKTQSSVYSDNEQANLKRRRLDDELRIRELELQTSYQIKSLSDSLSYLKEDFHEWRDSTNTTMTNVKSQMDRLRLQGMIVIALLISQLAGAPKFVAQLFSMAGVM